MPKSLRCKIKKLCYNGTLTERERDRILKALDQEERDIKINALEQQPNRCDSCKHSEERDGSNCYECVKGIADNFEAQPTDAVSREAVIQIIENKLNPCTDMFKCLEMSEIKEDVEQLPPVQPQRPKGMWIEVDPLGIGHKAYMCSNCKTGDWSITVHEYKYCPYCGAEMSGGGEDGK